MRNATRFDRLAVMFEHARALEPSQRAAYFDRMCADDGELRGELERLLASHTEKGMLDEPVPVPDALCMPADPATIGRYRVIECIGRGGMGAVYRAEQDHPRRTVAVKIMSAGLLSAESLRRFEFEASVLGRLQHPGIAQIYEAGTHETGGAPRPYFAMELVAGVGLDRFVEESRPSVATRLGLFIAVCDAVQHAHQKGIIHRDLKPANILVTQAGDPRILDFGVARATDSDLRSTVQTVPGQIIGTLAYMSPEQIGTRPERLDTRSDVYALGVILYEVLADRLPYDLTGCSIGAAARVIGEVDPSPLTGVSRGYRGDLNTIVLKALRKDPDQRYQSASDLASDVRRFLNHEPIDARPATALYHVGKFARRHRGLVGGLTLAALAFMVGVIGVAWKSSEVAEQSRLVAAEAASRRDVALFLREMLVSLDPAKTGGEPLTVRMMLDDAAAKLDGFAGSPEVRADLNNTVGTTYQLLGEYELAEIYMRAAIDGLTRERGIGDEQTLRAISTFAVGLREMDRLEEAEALLLQTLAAARDSESDSLDWVRTNLAIVIDLAGRTAEAEIMFRAIYERSLRERGADHPDTLTDRRNLAKTILGLGRTGEALPMFESLLAGSRVRLGDDHPKTLLDMMNLSAALQRAGRLDEADVLAAEAAERSTRVLGPRHVRTLRRRQNVIRMALVRQDFAAAVVRAEDMLEVCEAELGKVHAETLAAVELFVTAIALGDSMERAESIALGWYRTLEAEHGADDRRTGRIAMLLFNLYDSWGKEDRKAEWLRRSRESAYEPPALDDVGSGEGDQAGGDA